MNKLMEDNKMNKKRKLRIGEINGEISSLINMLEEILYEEESYYENFPENLQGSQRYEDSENYISNLEDVICNLQEVESNLEEIQG